MKFAQKMKDVEQAPYLLAIYRDNEHHHLLKHALEYWEHRKPQFNAQTSQFNHLYKNPIIYCTYPPLDLIKRYKVSPSVILGSWHVRCPKIIRWAIDEMIDSDMAWPFFSEQFITRIVPHIEWDDELVFKFIHRGLACELLRANIKLTEDQHSAVIICA